MLNVNFPFWGSSTCSGFAVSTLKQYINHITNIDAYFLAINPKQTHLYNEILPSCDPEITYLSHGEKATVHKSTGPRAAWFSSWPVSVFQMQRPESNELLAIVWPSELTATETTPSEWPDNCCRNSSRLSFKSHTLTVSSKLPVTIKSLICSVGFVAESLEASGSSSSFSFPWLPVRPQATLQMLSSWASSCLCSREY